MENSVSGSPKSSFEKSFMRGSMNLPTKLISPWPEADQTTGFIHPILCCVMTKPEQAVSHDQKTAMLKFGVAQYDLTALSLCVSNHHSNATTHDETVWTMSVTLKTAKRAHQCRPMCNTFKVANPSGYQSSPLYSMVMPQYPRRPNRLTARLSEGGKWVTARPKIRNYMVSVATEAHARAAGPCQSHCRRKP
jgi:hypothetical protein